MPLFEQLEECVRAIEKRVAGFSPHVGVILGSGLGEFAESFEDKIAIPYTELPHFPTSSVPGHSGRLLLGKVNGVRAVAMQGRVHAYEGYAPWQVALPARVLCQLGVRALVVTNASGGIRTDFRAGDLMAITDHINLSGLSPLTGPNDERLGPRFPDMSAAYHPELLAELFKVAAKAGVPLARGVYAGVAGPAYETPAEIRMLRTLGADAVGMSTVLEVIAAAHAGVPVAGIACITNAAAGVGNKPLSHQEVAEVAHQARHGFSKLLSAFLPAAVRALEI